MLDHLGRRAVRAALCATVLAAGAITLAACNPMPPCSKNWTGAVNTNFSNPANWAENAVPGPADHACATTGATIVVDTPATVESVFFDGTVTIPVGSSLTNNSPTLQTISIIDTLVLNGTLGGDAPMALRGGTINGTVQGSSFFADLGVKPTTLTSLTVKGDKKAMGTTNFTWSGDVHLCDNGIFGLAGPTVTTVPLAVDTAGCSSVGSPQFGVSDTGSLTLDADLDASTVNVGNLGVLTVGAGHTLSAGTMTHYAGYNPTTTVGTGALLNIGSSNFVLDSGTLTGTGAVAADVSGAGKVIPGTNNAGALTIYGSYIPAAGASVEFALNGTTPGTNFGQFVVGSGAILTDGTVTATALPGFAPAAGTGIPLIVAAGLSGSFSGATLPTVSGRGVTVAYTPTEVDLRITDCDTATFHPGASLANMNLSGKDLTNCDLHGAGLFGTNLTNARLAGANFSSATWINTVTGLVSTLGQPNGWTGTNFAGTGLNLSAKNLSAVGSAMSGVNLSGANLTGANVTNANLTGGVLQGTNLTGATALNATIDGVDFTNATFTNANLSNAFGIPGVSLPATYGNTTCPSLVNSDANGGNCEEQWSSGGGGGGVHAGAGTAAVAAPGSKR